MRCCRTVTSLVVGLALVIWLFGSARVTLGQSQTKLVHHNQPIYGPTGHRILPRYDKPIPEKLPLSLSAHNNPVRFKNIWLRPLHRDN